MKKRRKKKKGLSAFEKNHGAIVKSALPLNPSRLGGRRGDGREWEACSPIMTALFESMN